MRSERVDVVIIGAGAAGLGAARTASERGLSFIVLEAMNRIGGRAHTDTETFGVPWDRGCHWLHSASVNPFRELADEYGFTYHQQPPLRLAHLGDRWAATEEVSAMLTSVERQWERIAEAGHRDADIPATEVVDLDDPYLPLLRTALAGEWSVDLDQVSTLDDVAYRDTDENWPVKEGYGSLIARHAAGIPVELSTPAQRIEWGRDGVRVTTPSGVVEGRRALITVSTKVIQDDVIAFDPALPTWKREAYDAIHLGNANKITFGVEASALGVEEPTSCWVKVSDSQGMWFGLKPFGFDLANGYLAGKLGEEAEREGEAAVLALGREALVKLLGSDVEGKITAQGCSMWQHEPWIRGAYGAARPGKAHLRRDLATPIDDCLYFAGEATSLDWFSTAHGAHLSGIAAVEAIAAELKVGEPT